MTCEPITPRDWMKDAACTAYDPELWFPTHDRMSVVEAKAICRACPVVSDCLAWAMADPDLDAIAGATTTRERMNARRRDRRSRKEEPA